MSFNQSKGEKSEAHYKKSGRSGNSGNQRNFSGSGGGKGGGGNAPPPQSSSSLNTSRSFKKPSNGPVGQSKVSVPNSNSEVNHSAPRAGQSTGQNGAHVQPPLPGVSDAPASGIVAKPTNPSASRNTRPVPKAPSSHSTAGISDSVAPSTPAKANVSKSFPLQFGSISPGVVNGMQIPARTSSAPPNLDEQKRDQARHGSLRAAPTVPIPAASKNQQPVKDSGINKQTSSAEPHVTSSQARRETHPQVLSAPGATVTQKPSVLPIHGISMPMPFQSQVPAPFGGPNSQIQSQGIATSSLQMPMPLTVGSAAQVQQQVFVSSLQSHPIQTQGMMPQGQSLNYAAQLGHQMPQMGNMGIGISPQFSPQQAGKFGVHRKAVKITHPETHEELRLDKRLDSYVDSGSSGPRSHPNVPPQSQPVPSFTPHQINYYPPLYYAGPQNAVPMTSTQMSTGPQVARYPYQVSQVSPSISYKNPSAPNSLPASRIGLPVHSAAEPSNLEHTQDAQAVTNSVPIPPVQVTVKPVAVSHGEKVGASSVKVSSPVRKGESPKLLRSPKEANTNYQHIGIDNGSENSTEPSKSSIEPTANLPSFSAGKQTMVASTTVPAQRLPSSTSPSVSTSPTLESASVINNTEDIQRETIGRSESFEDRQKKVGKNDARNVKLHNEEDASNPAGTSKSALPSSAEGLASIGTSGGLSLSSREPLSDTCVNSFASQSVNDVTRQGDGSDKSVLQSEGIISDNLDVSLQAKQDAVAVQLKEEHTEIMEGTSELSGATNHGSEIFDTPTELTQPESSEGNKQLVSDSNLKVATAINESGIVGPEKNEGSVDLCSSEGERIPENLVKSNTASHSNDADTTPSGCGLATSPHDYKRSDVETSTCGSDMGNTNEDVSVISHQSSNPDSAIVSSDSLKHEAKVTEITTDALVSTSMSGSKDKVTSETNRVKNNAAKGKKKRKDILKAADAAGSTSDLYMAYKGREEKQESVVASENMDSSSSVDVKQASADDTEKDAITAKEDGQIKAEPDDWEDAADMSTPKLRTSGAEKQDRVGRKYSRDFLMTLSDQCINLPGGFEIGADISEAVMSVQVGNLLDRDTYPNTGRIIDRPSGGPRSDRRGGGMLDDDKWNKSPGPYVSGRDSRMEGGHGGAAVGFRSGQGGNHGVLRNPRGQPAGQYVGGILSGPMQSLASQGGTQRSSSDADRWQRATGFQKGLIPSPQTPLQVMHKAERKYEIRKVSDIEEAKQRQLKAILNKLTPQNFEKLFEQVKEVNIDNADTLNGVISQIFDKALMEPTFCEMYANFCFYLSMELPDFSHDDEKITFKRVLLNKCQEEFERGEREQAEADRVEEEGEIKCSPEEREEKRIQARRRMLGNIRLIGELYKKKMLTERIMHECIKKLLGQHQTPNPDEEDVEALCKLMSTIGEMIDHPKAKVHIDAYYDTMANFSNNMKLSSRVRFMLKDAIDLRKNNWQQRRKVEGPKKIDEVHRDAAQERQAQATRLARGPSTNSSSRRGQPLDFGPRGSTVLSSPNSQMGGPRGYPPQVRGYAQDVRMEERHPYESRTLSVPLSQRPLDDNSITLGPQGGLARGMSVRGQPLMSGVPLVDIHSAGDPRRFAAGPNGYSSPSEWSSYAREEVVPRYAPERSTVMPAYDQSNLQERNMHPGTRDLRSADRSLDRSMAPSAAHVHGTSTVSLASSASEKVHSEERLRGMSMSAIREFYSAKDKEEVALCIKDLNSPSFYPSMISIWVTDSFERKDIERDLLAKLLVDLTKTRDSLLSPIQLLKGFESVLATLEDAVNDAPKAAEFLGRIFAKVILENIVSLREIGQLIQEGGEEPGSLQQIGLASEVLVTILEILRLEKGEPVFNEIRSSSNLRLEDFRPPDPVKSRKLETFF